jgi:hypothetical protein
MRGRVVGAFPGVMMAACLSWLCACGGDAFESGPPADGEPGPVDDDAPSPGPADVEVDPELDVAPGTALGDIPRADRATLCADLLRVFNADVDNDRYRNMYCTDLAWAASDGGSASCDEAFQACLEQVPTPALSDRVEGTLGCDDARDSFMTPAGPVVLDGACATVEQALDCWRAFGVAYERGFLDAVGDAPQSCSGAMQSPPDLSGQVGFSIPRACDQLVATATDCN